MDFTVEIWPRFRLTPQKRRASVIGCLLFGTACYYLGSERISKIPPDSVARRQSTRIIANSNGAGISSIKLPAALLPTPLFSEHFIQLDHENDNGHVNATHPPLDTLVSRSISTNPAQIVKNVDFLLDFAIVGFAKCGTTTLVEWLLQPPHNTNTSNQDDSSATTTTTTLPKLIRAPSHEPLWLRDQKPAKAVSVLYRCAQAEQKQRQERLLLPHQKVLKGYKNPSDIRSHVAFRIDQQGRVSCHFGRIGQDTLNSTAEWTLLRPWLDPSPLQRHPRMPNRVFFMETRQLAESKNNATRLQQIEQDLEDYLGLPRQYLDPRPLHIRPYSQYITTNLDDYRMDICAPQWAPVLDEMMKISRAASPWLRRYFIKSPDVVASSPEYLEELLKDWMINSCDKNDLNNERQE
ncbi:unknown protein [Seminavis robusta]|uniref:Sulfotransferase n=1 Tax=Seminavis robusta TaxID=568900 RepID=A0A9N8HWW5_9STRA|nr:unknown protein [Seminavis robusta]|eukprot:Sro1709_g292740.1 n/a (407) ;mRNA; r:22071-23472